MKSLHRCSAYLRATALGSLLMFAVQAQAQGDPLPSWNDGAAKQAIVAFVKDTTDKAGPKYVEPDARIVAFDQDGTTWVPKQPNYVDDVRL